MFRLKLQYLLCYGVNGCLLPFVPLYLRQLQLTDAQISNVMAVSGLAVILSPVLVTLIADKHMDARRVMAMLLILTGVCLAGIPMLSGFVAVTTGFLLLNILFVPIIPLQDGFNLAVQEHQRRVGLKPLGYHKIRVWGTIGFLVPGLLLYLLVHQWSVVTVVLYVAAVFAIACGLNALFLPKPSQDDKPHERKLPTAEAALILFGKDMIAFCIALFLLQMAAASYYTFYPIYLSQKVGIRREYVGMIMNIGVVIEIVFMLGFGRMMGRFGPRRFLMLGCILMACRMALLAAFPNPSVAIGSQVFHGVMVLLLGVGPVVLIDRLAENRYRNSIQGLFAMIVLGGGRIAGNLVVGPIAGQGYQMAYWWSAGLALVAMVLIFFGYQPKARHEPTAAIVSKPQSEGVPAASLEIA